MSERAKIFISDWISENVHNEPLADGDAYDQHITALWTSCVVDASRGGVALPEIEQAVGDLEDRLREEFERVFDPTVGGIKD